MLFFTAFAALFFYDIAIKKENAHIEFLKALLIPIFEENFCLCLY